MRFDSMQCSCGPSVSIASPIWPPCSAYLQATLDASSSAEELAGLLALLRSGDRAGGPATMQITSELRSYVTPGSGLASTSAAPVARRAALQSLSLCASALDRRLASALYILENALAVVLLHFLRYLPRPFGMATAAGGTGGQDTHMQEAALALDMMEIPEPGPDAAIKLGAPADVVFFKQRLHDTCLKVEELLTGVEEGDREGVLAHHRTDSLALLVRTLKAYCSSD